MPDTITHILFGKKILERYPAAADRQAFFLGCMGPDPLYYYNVLTPFNKKNAVYTASAIHGSRGSIFLDKGYEYLSEKSCETKKDQLTSYLAGFLSHYILDSAAHPYIDEMSKGYLNGHKRFEMNIDTLLLMELEGVKSKYFRFGDYLAPGRELIRTISDMFCYIAGHAYHIDLEPGTYIKSLAHMRRICSLFRDPAGILYLVTAAAEALTGKAGVMKYLFYRIPGKSAPDYMNITKKVFRYTFTEIFDRALDLFFENAGKTSRPDIFNNDFSGRPG